MTFRPVLSCQRAALTGLLAAALVACGGGGGGVTASPAAAAGSSDSPAAGPTPGAGAGSAAATNQALANPLAYAPLTAAPAHRYGSGSAQGALFDALNAARLAAGAGAVSQHSKLDQMAAAQLAYLAANPGTPIGSEQSPGAARYSAESPSGRASLAGYAGSVWEVVATNGRYSSADCATALLDSAYRAAGALGTHRDVGVAYGAVAPGVYACVVTLGVQASTYAQLPAAGTLKAWPHAAQSGVRTQVASADFPAAGGLAAGIGRPVWVSMFDTGSLPASNHRVSRFALLDDAGLELPARLLANAEMQADAGLALLTDDSAGRLQSGEVLLLPLAPLATGRRYTVEFSGISGSQRYERRWSFTTG